MVMLQAFVDDSASDTGDRRLFLAGYVNGAEQWAAFSDEWEKELKRHPAIDYFKMSEAESRGARGQFAGWSIKDRDEKVIRLARIIHTYQPCAVYCSVSRKEFDEILAPAAPYPLKNPYGACFWGVMQTTARYHRSLDIENFPPVDFIFDEQGGLGTQAAMWYRWEKELDPSIGALLGGPPIFRNDKQLVALQAADMLAWHLRREHEYGLKENRPAAPLLMGHLVVGVDIDADTLRGLAKKMRRVPGVRRIQTKASWRGARRTTEGIIAAGYGPPNTNLLRMHLLNAKVSLSNLIATLRRSRRR
jgi:hypothetical protein